MRKLVVVPNSFASRGQRALANTLSNMFGYKVYRVPLHRVRNRDAFVFQHGMDKLTQLKCFNWKQLEHPKFTTDKAVAKQWAEEGSVVCRRLLRAAEGRGIVIATNPDEVIDAPLYTEYIKKKAEYRVHVLYEEAIDVQQKRKRRGVDERDTRIRNTANGYVFCREGLVEPDGLRQLAVDAVAAVGYKLGAVDIVHNVRGNRLAVLEVNACPGMEGTTLDNYASCIHFNKIVRDLS